MTRQQWQDPQFSSAYNRARYAKRKKAGLSHKPKLGWLADKMYCPPVMRVGVCLPSV